MKLTVKNVLSILAIMISAFTTASAQANDPLPSAEDVVAKMMQFDSERQSELTGYTAIRHYAAVNNRRHAEMVVHVSCDSSGAKEFAIVSEEGSGSIRKHVFHKLLSEETEASRRGSRKNTRLIPDNTSFGWWGGRVSRQDRRTCCPSFQKRRTST